MKYTDDNVCSVKAELSGNLRRFPLEVLKFETLCKQVVDLYGLDKGEDLLLSYIDDEGDNVILSSDVELKEAVRISNGILRLRITLKGKAKTAPTVGQGAPADAPRPITAPLNNAGAKEEKRAWKENKCAQKAEWRQWKVEHQAERKQAIMEWRLQKARALGKLVARHVKDVTVEDGTELPPNTTFVKTWRVRNEGAEWPAGCRLMFISRNGDRMGGPDFVPLPVEGPVQTSQEVDISVPLVAPSEPGRYVGYWRLCTSDGRKFGQRVWVSIVVPSTSSSDDNSSPKAADSEKYEELANVIAEMGFTAKKKLVVRLLNKHEGDVAKVVNILTKRGKALQ